MKTLVTAEIDVVTPIGRRINKKLEQHQRKTYTHQQVWDMVEKRLSNHYGVEIKFD